MNEELPPVETFIAPQQPAPLPKDEREGWTSASNARADALCPGRHQAQKNRPDLERPEGWSEFGTAVHQALYKDNPEGLTEEGLQVYEACVDITKKVRDQFFGDEVGDLLTMSEQRLWWYTKDRTLKHSGKYDRVYRSKTKALVIDYKTLPGDAGVASNNEQLRDLAVLVHGTMLVKTVGVVVIQPMVTTEPEICLYQEADLKESYQRMIERVAASNKPGAPRYAGTVQCKWCRAQGTCIEYERFAAGQLPALKDFGEHPVANWSVEQVLVFLDHYKVAEDWLEFCLREVKKRVKAGEIPGWVIGPGDRKGTVTDIMVLRDRLATLGIPNDEFVALCSPGKAGIERAVRNLTNLKGKELTAKLREIYAGIVSDERKAGSLEKAKAQ